MNGSNAFDCTKHTLFFQVVLSNNDGIGSRSLPLGFKLTFNFDRRRKQEINLLSMLNTDFVLPKQTQVASRLMFPCLFIVGVKFVLYNMAICARIKD